MKVALLHWYQANETGITFFIGEEPRDICFDGSSVWVLCSSSVAELRAHDGEALGGIGGLSGEWEEADLKGICFDGANIWVTDFGNSEVTKHPLVSGHSVPVSVRLPEPWGICFDGANIWVANGEGVSKIRASDGTVIGEPIDVGNEPRDICFDGAYIWVGSWGEGSITKIRASDGKVISTIPGLIEPRGICFGGSYIWMGISGFDSGVWSWPPELEQTPAVIALDRNGIPAFFSSVDGYPSDICFDGESIWVTNHDLDTVTKISVDEGFLGTFAVGDEPMGMCFDGVNIWVANSNGSSVTKL
jgi:hypothetical protein